MVNVDESYDSFFCFNIVLSPEVFYKTVNREMKGPEFIIKSFQQSGKTVLFKHVGHSHFIKAPEYPAVLVDSLLTVIESLPKDQFDLVNDEELIGFMRPLQGKANILMIRHKKLVFSRAS